ncbi:CBASS oligonucleotide cyclase [Sorangium sp. So ce136]|uniref:CBASS oligonucleotide cyclase n=1 Tax=Sorangium sp. So ce136 TaxID=3133284 RepID=UPI003F112EAD
MSGSGGSFDPEKLRSQIRDLEGKIDDAEYESQVAALLGAILTDANDRDMELIQDHLDAIKKAIEKEVDGFVDLLFGGSIAKQTYVKGISDVDALVIIDSSDLSSKTPLEVRDYIIARLQERLPYAHVEPDGFAVTVNYADGAVQLVPVKRHGDDFLLPSADCREWSRVRPRMFTDALTKANRDLSGKVVPTIKLAKAALADMPDARRPTGYHLEALALDVFANYQGPRTPKHMLTYFFARAAERVLQPVPDRTGQSRYVDAHLGVPMSLERQILADSMGRIARRLQNADGARAVDLWKRILGVE